MFCRKYNLFARLPLANSSFVWIVGPCCVLLAVAFHGLPTHRFKLQIPSIVAFKTPHTTCFHLHLLTSTAEIHRCGQACRQKLLASTSCSIWLSDFAPSTLLQMAQLLQCTPRTEPFHLEIVHNSCTVSNHPAPHDQVQFLSCISLRHLHEMLEAVPESSNLLVLHVPNSLSSLLALQSQSELWIDTFTPKCLPHQEYLVPGHTSTLP